MISPLAGKTVQLVFSQKIQSKPYLHMTLNLMEQNGIHLERKSNGIVIHPGQYEVLPRPIENDWSAAAFFYTWLAIMPIEEINMDGLLESSLQGDQFIAQYAGHWGLETEFSPGGIKIKKQNPVKTHLTDLDLSKFPDLFPPVAMCHAMFGSSCAYHGTDVLKIKESDRMAEMSKLFANGGVHFIELDEFVGRSSASGWFVQKGKYRSKSKTLDVNASRDHRMAMAASLLATRYSSVKIFGHGAVGKSFPKYWSQLERLGVTHNFSSRNPEF